MAIANALAAEPGVCCTHEGKVRIRERAGRQVLRYLTLENRLAYERPERAIELWNTARSSLGQIAFSQGCSHFGDIAYNYAPFLDAIRESLPNAKLVVFFRNGVDFVRSASEATREDETPLGWPPAEKPLTPVEKFVSLGRLAPRSIDPLAEQWSSLDYAIKNAWLWAETNRLIVAAIERRRRGTTFIVKFEQFFADPVNNYIELRDFLCIGGAPAPTALELLSSPINQRRNRALGPFDTWNKTQQEGFVSVAGQMMYELGYRMPDTASAD